MNEMTTVENRGLIQTGIDVISPEILKARALAVQKAKEAIMKPGVHYGKIPGTGGKDTLLKPGGEALLSTFQVGAFPEVEDLSEGDVIRYRVLVRGVHLPTGQDIGVGIGECSSAEEKYAWREAICPEEFDAADPADRRVKWRRGQGGKPYSKQQVRVNAADVANTVLKMGKKRGLIDLALTALAASDVFAQDLEELSAELREHVARDEAPMKEPPRQPQEKEGPPPAITEHQVKMLYAKLQNAPDEVVEDLRSHFKLEHLKDLPRPKMQDALGWIAAKRKASKAAKPTEEPPKETPAEVDNRDHEAVS